jgi:hypothetical protein
VESQQLQSVELVVSKELISYFVVKKVVMSL